MRSILVLFAVGAAGAAGYLAGDGAFIDVGTIVVAALAAVALFLAWGITPNGPTPKTKAAPARPAANAPGQAARRIDQERVLAENPLVSVRLTLVGKNQIAIIKVLRRHFDLQLKEAKDLTDGAKEGARPLLHGQLPATDARSLAADIEDSGGQVELAAPEGATR